MNANMTKIRPWDSRQPFVVAAVSLSGLLALSSCTAVQRPELTAKQPASIASKIDAAQTPAETPTLFSLRVGTTSEASGLNLIQNDSGYLAFKGLRLVDFLGGVYGIPPNRVIAPAEFMDKRLDCELHAPPDRKREGVNVLKNAIEAAFGIRSRIARRTMDVYVLTCPSKPPAALRPTDTPTAIVPIDADQFQGCAELSALCALLSDHLDHAVLDETGLEGIFEIAIDFSNIEPQGTPDRIASAIRQQTGLELHATQCDIEVLIIEADDGMGARD